jgi:hypothetical protein
LPKDSLDGLGVDLRVGHNGKKIVGIDSILSQNVVDQGASDGNTDDSAHAPEE